MNTERKTKVRVHWLKTGPQLLDFTGREIEEKSDCPVLWEFGLSRDVLKTYNESMSKIKKRFLDFGRKGHVDLYQGIRLLKIILTDAYHND